MKADFVKLSLKDTTVTELKPTIDSMSDKEKDFYFLFISSLIFIF